jgi:2-oxoglutarate dehydrogenase E2 component (dihydrolipoamide succinyltransferase)
MAVDIKVTPAGESITHAVLLKWLKPDGSAVKAGEPACELETDKATKEEYAPASGVLSIRVHPGTRVAIGAVIGAVDPSRSAGPGAGHPAGPRTRGEPARDDRAAPRPSPERAPTTPKPVPHEGNSVTPAEPAAAPAGEVRLSPAARVLVESQGIDAARVPPSPRGVVTKSDVLSFLENRPQAAPVEAEGKAKEATQPEPRPEPPTEPKPEARPVGLSGAPGGDRPRGAGGPERSEHTPAERTPRETRQRMTPIRARIAERLLAAQQNAAILTTFNEVDMSRVMELRARYKEGFQKKHGVGLGFMGFFVKASVEALRAFPAVNARIDGADVVYQHFYHLGVAVSTDKGLMVPVLRDCDRLSFSWIEKGIAELAAKAREGKLSVTDLQGGTFTITNGGVFGSLVSTPILNPPQSAILGMHAIQKRAVVVDDQIVIRPMMYLALSYDHRLIDGREAVSFLVRVKECIENPERLLLEV